jgi:hypothetical protein
MVLLTLYLLVTYRRHHIRFGFYYFHVHGMGSPLSSSQRLSECSVHSVYSNSSVYSVHSVY